MKVTISALGLIKEYLPHDKTVEIEEDNLDLSALMKNVADISPKEIGMLFIVNGRIRKESYVPQNNDKIVVMKMGGAG